MSAPSGGAEGAPSAAARSAAAARSELFNDLMRVLSQVLDAEGGVKLFHAWRVAVLASVLGERLGRDRGLLHHAGLVHDLGGLDLADPLVHCAAGANGPPDARMHAARTARILRPLTALRALAPVVEHHHERVDGRGYPRGLAGAEVPFDASIVHFADQIELALRVTPATRRRARAAEVTADLCPAACPQAIGDAFAAILEGDARLLDELYDDPAALERRVRALATVPTGLADVGELELLAQLLWVLARVVDTKHARTMGHSARVAFYARDIAARLGGDVDPWDVVCAALLHDIGNVAVPRALLDKVDASGDELARVARHPVHTREMVASIGRLAHLALAAASHHEAYDGSGYPLGLRGEAIPLVGRILAYADRYDTLRGDRGDRPGLAADEALAVLRAEVGTRLDPALADLALESLAAHVEAPSSSQDLLGYQRFFHSDEPDLERVVRGARRAPPAGQRWVTAEIDDDGSLRAGATALGALTGVRSTALVDHVAPTTRPRLAAELERARGGASVSTTHATPAGAPIEVLLGRTTAGVVAMIGPATALRSMRELALVHRNFLLSSEAVVLCDAEARIVDVNYAFSRLFGWSAAEVLGRTPRLLQSGLHPPATYREMRECLRDPLVGTWSGELVDRTKSGDLVHVQLTINTVRSSAGAVVGYLSNAIDVTARRRAQQALEERERELVEKNRELERLSQFKSQIVAITSHDLRAPLAAMIGLAEQVRDADDATLDRDGVRAHAAKIADAGHRLMTLASDLLDLDKCEAGTLALHVRPISVDGLVEAVAAAAGLAPPWPSGAETIVVADPDRLDQALANLVGNALKLSPAESVRLGCDVVGDAVRLWVADRGPGIPEAAIATVFDRYVQVDRGETSPRRATGVGLGLAIVRHMAELHGGRARVANRPGGGCCFEIELPRRSPNDPGLAPSALLVGPREDDLERARHALRAAGFSTVVAERPSEAKRRLLVEAPPLVVVDERIVDDELARTLDRARRRAQTTVALLRFDDGAPGRVRADRELVAPVLDVELAHLARTATAQRAPASSPKPTPSLRART